MSASTRQKVLAEEFRIKLGSSPDPCFDIAKIFDQATTVVKLRKRAERHRDAMRVFLEYAALVCRLSRMACTDMNAGFLHSPPACESYLSSADFAADVSQYVKDKQLFVESLVRARSEAILMELYAERFDNRSVNPMDLLIDRMIELTTVPGDNN